MMLVLLVSAFLLSSCVLVQPLKLPESWSVCSRSDPKYNECLLVAVENAIKDLKEGSKELKLLPLDPVEVTKIVISQGSGPVSLSLELLNSKTYGTTTLKLKTASEERTPAGKYFISGSGTTPQLHMDADYVMDGKFLILPVKGNGKCNLTITDSEAQIDITGEDWVKDGKVYMKVTGFKITIKKISGFRVHFENLFNGDKTLGDSTNALLNENWSEFWGELKHSFEDTFSQVFEGYATKVYHNIPYNEIVLD